MLSIGEFAGMTGLSVKALRHYDEKGVLIPSEVDETSGYRRYAEDQVRAGVVVRALRDADVPLMAVAGAVAGGDARALLAAHREEVLTARAREDEAFAAADRVLSALSAPVEVIERASASQPYVGRVLSLSADDAEQPSDEAANEQFGQLFMELQRAGLGPSGQFWTALRGGRQGQVELLCCWPTPGQLDSGWGGPETLVGALPPRSELVARWPAGDGQDLPEGAAHPALVALFDAIAERDINLRGMEVRQTIVGDSERDYTVEVAITVAERWPGPGPSPQTRSLGVSPGNRWGCGPG